MNLEESQESALFSKLRHWMNLNTDNNDTAAIFALAELIQDRLDKVDLTDTEKGGILTGILTGLVEANSIELAHYRDLKRHIIDRKVATIH